MSNPTRLPWLEPGAAFPPPVAAWDRSMPAPGLLAAGGALDVDTLQRAYGSGIFPWFSDGQPILWWSPDPRMVLRCAEFQLHRSLRKTLQRFVAARDAEVRIDSAFADVIRSCATHLRRQQDGTWIVPSMIDAYCALHAAGLAHSVETWIEGRLAGGLYCVSIGRAVFGESMFAHATDASKIALAALVAFGLEHGIDAIDCQQNTVHLASLGAREMPRERFLRIVRDAVAQPAPRWRFDPVYWNRLLPIRT